MELTTLISIAVAAVLAWPQDIARQRIVLLPSIDGAQSAVLLQTPHGERLLDRPFASLDVMDKGGLKESVLTEAEVSDRYGLLLAAQPPRPKSFLLYFESGSDSQLTPESSQVLMGLKAFLQSRPAPEVTVIGHTDRSGSVTGNDALSQQRAKTVQALIRQSGIDADNMLVLGRGSREPVASGANDALNRRVEIHVR